MPGAWDLGPHGRLKGDAAWPGVRQVKSFAYTVSHGITPGTAVLTIAPTDLSQIAEVGDLVITDGARSVTLADCHVAEPSYSAGAGGQVMRLVIEDHRWRWSKVPLVSGHYNIVEERYFDIPPVSTWDAPQGNQPHPPYIPPGEEPIRKETKKTAPELARLLLDALGEPDAVITGLDPRATPSVNWDATPPAHALQALVEQFGCTVVSRPVSGGVLIAKVGEGGPLPDGPILEEAPSLSVKARPEKITLYGAPARFQWRFQLEAVGIDFDETYGPIDDLSYKPIAGWAATSPPTWGMLPGPFTPGGAPGPGGGILPGKRTYYDARALASRSVYRMYRITLKDVATGGPLVIRPPRGHGPEVKITDRRQVRLLPVKNDASKDDLGRTVQWPAACYGRHTRPQAVLAGKQIQKDFALTDGNTEVKVPFAIDQVQQIIVFTDVVAAWKTDGKVYPADEIVLECACEVLDPVTWSPYRYQKSITVANGIPGTEAVIVRDDVRYEVVMQYRTVLVHGDGAPDHYDTRTVGAIDNADTIAPRADWYLVGESQRYMTAAAERRKYVGIQLVDPDGAVQQVTWSFGGGDLSTTASLGTEHNLYVPPFAQRRRTEYSDLVLFRQENILAPAPDPFGNTQGNVMVRGL